MLLGRQQQQQQLHSYSYIATPLPRPNASSGSTMDLVYDGSGNLANIDPWRSSKNSIVLCNNNNNNNTEYLLNIFYMSICYMFIVLNYILHHLVFNFRISKELALQELAREEVRLEAQQSCNFRIQRLETVENWYFRFFFWGSILQLLFSMHFWRWWTDSDFNGKNLKSRWPGKTRNFARWEAGRLAQSVWCRCAQVYQIDIPWWRLFWSWFPERLKG